MQVNRVNLPKVAKAPKQVEGGQIRFDWRFKGLGKPGWRCTSKR